MAQAKPESRGLTWMRTLTGSDGVVAQGPLTVRVADGIVGGMQARFIAVVPDPLSRFPRARSGEVGLDEGWALAHAVRATMTADDHSTRRPIVAVVDVSSQAYGRYEELLGIHLACAAAADAYAAARLAGHVVVGLLVGSAMSGAFLAHGYQANRLLALDSPGVIVHAMGKLAAARITRRSIEELENLGQLQTPMAYDIRAYAKLGLLHGLIAGVNADKPGRADVQLVHHEIAAAIADVLSSSAPRDLATRLSSSSSQKLRAASLAVRQRLREQWDES